MEIDINKKYERYFANDEPIPYMPRALEQKYKKIKKEIEEIESFEFRTETLNNYLEHYKTELQLIKPIYIYPVYTRDYIDFNYAVCCLLLEKNKNPNPEIISMSYLDFLMYIIRNDENGTIYSDMLAIILNLCLHSENAKFSYPNGQSVRLFIDDIEINKKDFDDIKRIICYQNFPDFDDTYIDPELQESLNHADELKNKNKGTTTFEDQKICLMLSSPLKLEDIDKLTMRKFIKSLKKADAKLHYQIYMTGYTWDKENLTHWMYEKNNKYDGLVNFDSFKQKIESA